MRSSGADVAVGVPRRSSEIGRRVARLEDARLLRGEGAFLDDVDDRGAGHAAFRRSTRAHARIIDVDVSAARGRPGVLAVYTHHDLGAVDRPLPQVSPHPDILHARCPYPLARDRARFVGEPIAMVVAESRYVAEDACELIEVTSEPLAVVVDPDQAGAEGAPLVHDDAPGNIAARSLQRVGDPDGAFSNADVVVRRRIDIERSAGMPLECRGVLAAYDRRTGELTVWDSTQAPTSIRSGLASILGIDERLVRVVAPDVGGGFGAKVMLFYPEEVLVPWAAMMLGRPVKWVEDRAEHFVASHHERRQVHEIELAATRSGEVVGLRDRFVHDNGAYCSYGIDVAVVAAAQIAGPYRIPNVEVEFDAVYTNTTQVSPYRGCGRPHACMALELAMDALADELEVDRMELRRRNLIGVDEFPYERSGLTFADGQPVVLDSGDYLAGLDQVLHALDYEAFRAEQADARAAGKLLGLGLACYIEGTGLGPYEGARIEVDARTGRIRVAVGVATQGQSHRTTFAQVAAARLGVRIEDVVVETGDTAAFPYGAGAFASRSAVVGGNAVDRAAAELRGRALRLAAEMLDAEAHELDIEAGAVLRRGRPTGLELRDIAAASNPLLYGLQGDETGATEAIGPPFDPDGPPLPEGEIPGLHATGYYSPPGAAWASGVHGAIIEIDPETYEVAWRRYVCSHDCGTVLNPTVVEGQVIGGIAQGVAGALYERLQYDPGGQLQNASFMEFLIPYATEIPRVEIHHQETASPLNPLGIKGVGEAGAIAPPAVLVSAVRDALGNLGVEVLEAPLTPSRIYSAIQGATSSG